MKITITGVGKGWKPKDNPDADPLYSINILGQSEPQKTYDPLLAVPGEHEAETFQSKTGKTYWRTPKDSQKPSQPSQTQFKADPIKQESIEWQACLKAAVQAVHDYSELHGLLNGSGETKTLAEYKKDIVETLVTFTRSIGTKPDTIAPKETMTDQGDFAQVAGVDYDSSDEPPVEVYDAIPY